MVVRGHTAAADRLRALDGYRAVAAIGVLVYHVAGTSGMLDPLEPGGHLLDNLGNFGVGVFFLLSGFLLYRPFLNASVDATRPPGIGGFYLRRAVRIFPAYWVALIGWSLTATPEQRAPGTTLGKLLLIDPYDSDVNTWPAGLPVAWTLTIELTYYLVLPVYALAVAAVASRTGSPRQRLAVHAAGLAVLWIVALAYRWWWPSWEGRPFLSRDWLPTFADWFALGMLMAVLRHPGLDERLVAAVRSFASRTWACWLVAATAYVSIVLMTRDGLYFDARPTSTSFQWRQVLQGIAAFFFLLPATVGAAQGVAMRWFSSRPLVFLGTVSYGIYLWHVTVLRWIDGIGDDWPSRSQFVVLVALTMVISVSIATVSYFVVEQPAMGLASSPRAPRADGCGSVSTA
jgi:peptidoglycan/LPS O-acetylase OafA/YrhL